MRRLARSRSITASTLCLLLAVPLTCARAQESPPTLMRFSYLEKVAEGNPKRAEVAVPAVPGATASPLHGKSLLTIAVLPGTPVTLSAPPVDVVVDLYQGAASIGGNLICSIRVRYVRDADGAFVPHYQIHQEPLVFRGPGGRWIPIEALCANPSVFKFRARTPANRDGFYSTFEFGLNGHRLQIDSWVVR